jgi:cell division protein FtsW
MPLLINWILLLIFWLLAVYSTSVYESFTMSLSSINRWFTTFTEPTNYYYFYQQIKALIYIAVLFIILRKFPVKSLKNHKVAWILMFWTFIFQCLVFTPLWDSYNWARWWLNIPHIPSIQPSEFFKLAYVIFLASWLMRKKENMNSPQFLLIFIVLNAILFFIFLLIPDFWTVLIIWATALIMVRFSWLKLKKTLAILWIWLWAWVIAWLTLWLVSNKFSYITKRFEYFFTTDKDKIEEERERTWWQTTQALIAIWWWGFMWNWYGNWLQKYSNLPEAYCDFIFAAFSEEIWFIWNLFLIALYVWMFWYVLKHLQKVNDPHLKLIWVWIISLIIIQTFVNIWVNVQIIPTTWITLPFVSAWWSSLMVNCVELLLLYKILKTENKILPVN